MIGLGFSGGMDSTILLYELLNKTKEHIVCITHDIRLHNTVAYKNAAKVLTNFESDRITHYIDSTYELNRFQTYVRAIVKFKLTDFYVGTTKIAEHILNDTRHTMMNGNDRIDFRNQIMSGVKMHQPYFDLYRTDIIKKYIKYDIIDIMNMTNSCDKSIEIPCGECQGCRDRKWGLECVKC